MRLAEIVEKRELDEEDVIHNGSCVDRQAQREHERVAASLPKVEPLKEKDSGDN